jgi:hypothetical protein
VGVGTNTPSGGLHVFGSGQTTNSPALTPASSNGATLFLQDSGTSAGNGGLLVFGSGNGFFAGLKGLAVDNSGNTTGSLIFLTRGQTTNATLSERMRILPSGNILIGPAWDENAKMHILETEPRMWTFVSDTIPTIAQNGTYFIWAGALRNWDNVGSGATHTGAAGGLYAEAYNVGLGHLTNAVGVDVGVGTRAAGTVNVAVGVNVHMQGAVAAGYGVFVDDLTATSSWGIYQNGANDQNYFAGRIGIGTTTPNVNTLLDVNGNANFAGTVTGGNIQAKFQDVAEWVPSRDDLAPGTVVVLDPNASNMVVESTTSYDTTVAGVVSAQPGISLGVAAAGKEQIATTGRVKVRVDATAGAIHIGDLLVTSDKPGTAMKSRAVEIGGVTLHRPGTIIGKALEPLAGGEGEILVLLSLQ